MSTISVRLSRMWHVIQEEYRQELKRARPYEGPSAVLAFDSPTLQRNVLDSFLYERSFEIRTFASTAYIASDTLPFRLEKTIANGRKSTKGNAC